MNDASPSPDEGDQRSGNANWMGFLGALQFLTILPPLVKRPFTPRELGMAVGWFPLIGFLIALVLVSADALLGLIFPLSVASALLLAVWVLLSGALHLDGFLDACDGLLGGWTPEKRLEILRDERVGAFALAGGILLLLLKFSALISLSQRYEGLVLAPTLGRWCMTLGVVAYPYARPDGLGRSMKDNAGWMQIGMASVITIVIAWLVGGVAGLVTIGVALLVVWSVVGFTLKLIPGLTGDIYGAINEIVELVVLLTWVVIQTRATG